MSPATWERPAAPTAVEEVQAGEAEAIGQMIRKLKQQLTDRYIANKALVRRDAHPKLLGLVRATFTVSPDCPAELRHGIFATQGTQYQAVIRFSNGNPELQHDLAADVRGMAIKLPDVPGRSIPLPEHLGGGALQWDGQDFVLATAEAFFGSNTVDYVGFIDASLTIPKTIWYFLGGLRLRGGLQLLKSRKIPPSPLALEYFSQTPYRFGPHCVKYCARPRVRRSSTGDPWYLRPVLRRIVGMAAGKLKSLFPRFPPDDALRRALKGDLKSGPVTFEFLVQRWQNLGQLPKWAIENATRTWPAPWVRVATIEIAQQEIDQRDEKAERMTFSPWHALEEHQPLGSINRARLAIYAVMSAFRNEHNPSGNK